MEKFLSADSGPIERGGEHDIEVEEGKWNNQEISFIYFTEFHCFYPLSPQDEDAGQDHPHQQDDRQRSQIPWHANSPGPFEIVVRNMAQARPVASKTWRVLLLDLNDTVQSYMAPIQVFSPLVPGNKSDRLGAPDLLFPFDTPRNRTITWDHMDGFVQAAARVSECDVRGKAAPGFGFVPAPKGRSRNPHSSFGYDLNFRRPTLATTPTSFAART
jgi:hypothetical protein